MKDAIPSVLRKTGTDTNWWSDTLYIFHVLSTHCEKWTQNRDIIWSNAHDSPLNLTKGFQRYFVWQAYAKRWHVIHSLLCTIPYNSFFACSLNHTLSPKSATLILSTLTECIFEEISSTTGFIYTTWTSSLMTLKIMGVWLVLLLYVQKNLDWNLCFKTTCSDSGFWCFFFSSSIVLDQYLETGSNYISLTLAAHM